VIFLFFYYFYFYQWSFYVPTMNRVRKNIGK
jgi:hypothetical protein